MRIRRLQLRDFGLFRGAQELDLQPRKRNGRTRPVVLVGGHNGAGKTTILESVRLCLYGRLALGSRIPDSVYHQYLRERIHRNPAAVVKQDHASVSLEFDYARDGKLSVYTVRRFWAARGEAIDEELIVLRDGQALSDVDSESWPEFVRSLVPFGVSQLFFFDGEKIQRLAEDESHAAELGDSLKALFGLDLVERLQADLDLFVTREVRNSRKTQATERLAEVEKKIEELEVARAAAVQEEAQLRSQLGHLNSRVEHAELQLAEVGGCLAQGRASSTAKKKELIRAVERLEREFRDLCDGVLFASACPALVRDTLTQLAAEAEVSGWDVSRRNAERLVESARAKVVGDAAKRLGLNRQQKAVLSDAFDEILGEYTRQPERLSAVRPAHGVSSEAEAAIRRLLTMELDHASSKATEAAESLRSAESELHRVQHRLNTMPEKEELAPVVGQLSELHRAHAEKDAALALVEERKANIENELGTLGRERERIARSEAETSKARERVSLAQNVRAALDDYLVRLTAAKVAQLETETCRAFQQLSRKTDLVHSIRISPDNFDVRLLDQVGVEIRKSDLSAGEKQIYAVAILWGLARVSGRTLPLIIDTPLGRLDSIHRMKLLEGYFRTAAHQTVILSTDTEIDRGLYEALEDDVSHSFRLINHGGWTEIEEGYFWKNEETARAQAAV